MPDGCVTDENDVGARNPSAWPCMLGHVQSAMDEMPILSLSLQGRAGGLCHGRRVTGGEEEVNTKLHL